MSAAGLRAGTQCELVIDSCLNGWCIVGGHGVVDVRHWRWCGVTCVGWHADARSNRFAKKQQPAGISQVAVHDATHWRSQAALPL